ncbi:MAG TPA: prolyl oligopeptidase family serine peptidase [Candidatus Acidoferrales bacterium]
MKWFEQKIRRYEHMRWAQEPNRRALPFGWGLEHIIESPNGTSPRVLLDRFVADTIASSDDWFAATPVADYKLENSVLTFTSQIASPWPENNRVHAQFFPGRKPGAAVVVLAQWNARWEEQQGVCRWLNRLGLTAVKMSLPYHDRRAIPDHPRADHLVGPNIGLTIQANRQAVIDARRVFRWLESQGYDQLGIIGTSIGSCIGFITMCHEPAIRAGAFLHASTYFGEVVSQGLTTMNVWEPMKQHVTREEAIRYWSPISPFPYIPKLRGAGKKILAITGRYDPTFWPELTEQFLAELRQNSVKFDHLSLPCGHYSLGVTPFSQVVGHRFGKFLTRVLR